MFEIRYIAADQVYYYEFNKKNRKIWLRAQQSFLFLKSQTPKFFFLILRYFSFTK